MSEVSQAHLLGGQFEATFRRHGVPFELVEEFPIEQIVFNRNVQVREKDIAPTHRVRRYEEQMNAGTVFPPLVIRKQDKALLDGNTRLAAYNRIGRAATAVYVVDPRNDNTAVILAASLNQLGGADLHPDEARAAALKMSRQGFSVAAISKEIGVSGAKITRWQNVEAGRKHAERLGQSDAFDDLSQNNQETLAKVSRDGAFVELLKVMTEQQPKTPELKDLVKRVNVAGSDDEALEDVRRTSLAWPESDGSKSRSKSPAMAAEAPLTKLAKQDPGYWVDRAQSERLLPLWRQVRDLANAVVAQYEA